ncbi:MAG: hypothetical protein GWN86_15285, partial [Desulfobacterales bacterium]|nr:hypothetical protein [Desulfobacterales bacterium]
VSYDFFTVGPSPSPGGVEGFEDYYPEDIIGDIAANGDVDGEYIPGPTIFTEIEVMIKVSPICITLEGYKPSFNDYAWSG